MSKYPLKTLLSPWSFLLFLSPFTLQAQELVFKPAGKLQLRYENNTKKYTPLGQSLYKNNSLSYDDFIFGGSFGVQSFWENYSVTSLFYGVERLSSKNQNPLKNEKSFYSNTQDDFIYLGELNLKKEFDEHAVILGRQSYDSSLVNSNFRITQNAYEGVSYFFKDKNVNFQSLYFQKISSSTMSNNVPYNHKYGFLGYGLGYDTSGYTKISQHIINEDLPTHAAVHFTGTYDTPTHNISYENLYVDNFFNTSKLTLGYKLNSFHFQTGMIYQTSVGNKNVERAIETSQKGKKLQAQHYQAQIKYQEGTLQLLYSISLTPSDANSIYKGTLLSPFSNQPTWLVGLNTSHATIADTLSQKILLIKSTQVYEIPVVLAAAYIDYDIGKENGLTPGTIHTTESYWHVKGHFSKQLSAMIQYSYAENFDLLTQETYNTKLAIEYRF